MSCSGHGGTDSGPEAGSAPAAGRQPVSDGGTVPGPAPVVVSTRPKPSTAFARVLEQHGITVRHVPLTVIAEPDDWGPADRAIEHVQSYDGILLTSVNAAEKFFGRMQSHGEFPETTPPLYAVGQRTADAVHMFGLHCATILDRGGARQLARSLGSATGPRFLQPCSDIAREDAREELEQRGGTVDMVTVYRTRPAPGSSTRLLLAVLAESGPRCVAFFAPSGVQEFCSRIDLHSCAPHDPVEAGPGGARTLLYAAIGDTTAEALQAAGLRADIVAASQTAEQLATDIAAHFRYQQEHG